MVLLNVVDFKRRDIISRLGELSLHIVVLLQFSHNIVEYVVRTVFYTNRY